MEVIFYSVLQNAEINNQAFFALRRLNHYKK